MTAVLSPLRLGRITASRIPKVLGVSPFGNAESVMREMVREAWGADPEFTGNIATEWGQAHEQDALDYYMAETGAEVYGAQQFTLHPEYPDLFGMSPDGLTGPVLFAIDENGEQGVVEAKAPFRARYTSWQERPDYQTQLHLQMECSQRSFADFVVWRPYGTTITRMPYDPTWLSFNLPVLREFHERYLEIVGTAELTAKYLKPLVDERDDDDWRWAALEYLDAMADLEESQRRGDDAKARLKELADGKKTRGCGVLVSVSNPKGRVNTKAMHAAKGITAEDLDEFRGPAKGVVMSVKATATKPKQAGTDEDDTDDA